MDAAQLRQLGELLFGPDWRETMGRVLDVPPLTIQRWEKDNAAISLAVANTVWLMSRVHQLETELAAARRMAGFLDLGKR